MVAASAYRRVTRNARPGAGTRNRPGASAKSTSSVPRRSSLIGRVILVGDRENVVEDRDSFVELVARDRERRADHDHVPVRHEIEAALERCLAQARHGCCVFTAAIERHERLTRLARLHELEPPEAAEAPNLADRRMLLREPPQCIAECVAHLRGMLDDAFLAERLDRRDADSTCKGMAAVGEPAGEI